ncbi:MAG TPA: CDC27 family protein [Polyangiaceae bacterium]|jgi:tetratricopeptide (TPR) repeat protein|nr:CDC27 family protein [Polyangiaceae bacterium]
MGFGVWLAAGICVLRPAHADDKPAAAKAPDEASAPSDADKPDEEAMGVPIEVASKAQKEVARKQLQLGIDLLDAGKPADALQVLRMSYQRVESPNTRLMIARALEKLERYPEAYAELQQALSEAEPLARGASKYEDTVAALQSELEQVKAKVALVHLDLGMTLTAEGKPIEPERWGRVVVLPEGHTAFELKLANGQSRNVSTTLAGGKETTVALLLAAPANAEAAPAELAQPKPAVTSQEQPGVSRKTLGWIGVGMAGVGAASFVTFGLLDKAKHERLSDECGNGVCPADLRDDAERGRTYQSLANVGIGVGVVGLITATYFFLSARSEPKLSGSDSLRASAGTPSQHATQASPQIVIGARSVAISGRF